MNYDLAVQLKRAGFPLKCTTYSTDDFVFGVVVKGDDSVMYPLLPELIDTCRCSTPFRLHCYSHGFVIEFDDHTKDDMEIYKTAEEAVANLYLALHPIEPEVG